MAVGRAERFAARRPRVVAAFGDDARTLEVVFQVFTLMEMAWHDCYAELTPSEDVIDDVLVCSGGSLDQLVDAAHLAVIDRRDLALRAAAVRGTAADPP
jgi:hypothetical protein